MARAHTKTVIDAMIVALRAIDENGVDSFTPSSVQRHDEDLIVEGPPGSIIISRVSSNRGRDVGGHGWDITTEIEIDCNVFTSGLSAVPSDEAIEEAEEDVWRALVAVDWESLSAEFANFSALTFREEDPENPAAGFVATVEVQYTLAFDSPGTIINL